MSEDEHWSLPQLLDALPPPDQPISGPSGPHFPFDANYLPVIHRMWETLQQSGFPREGQYDYIPWGERYLNQAGARCFTADLVATMSREDCFYLLRTFQRTERFCTGHWGEVHGAGMFHAVIRRLIELDVGSGLQ